MTLGERIKGLRLSYGYTLETFGAKIDNADKGLVSKWERDQVVPNPKRLTLIAKEFDVSVQYLLGQERKPLSLNDYQQLSKRTMPRHDTQHSKREAILNYSLGICGESGEFADMVKKEYCHNHPQSHIEMVKELGDVLHYVSGLATILGVDLETVARVNIEKLEKRYPSGFSSEASINRVEG